MRRQLRYLSFGLMVLAAYWFTLQRGYVYYGADHAPSAPGAHGASMGRSRPASWSTGYQGGK
jgi:hypothetical protein